MFQQAEQELKWGAKMGVDYNLISAEINKISASVSLVCKKETLDLWKAVAMRYGSTGEYSFQFWDELIDFASIQNDDGWSIIGHWISTLKNLYLLFEMEDEKESFIFENGNELAIVLIESGCRDFYILDKDLSFLLCYTDHSVVMAAGSAKRWMAEI